MPGLLINIDVPDIEPGIAFYTAALGLRVGRRFREDFVELLGTDAPIYLLRNAAGTSIGPAGGDVRRYERHWSPIHPDFVVEEMDAAIARATAAGATPEWGRGLPHFLRHGPWRERFSRSIPCR